MTLIKKYLCSSLERSSVQRGAGGSERRGGVLTPLLAGEDEGGGAKAEGGFELSSAAASGVKWDVIPTFHQTCVLFVPEHGQAWLGTRRRKGEMVLTSLY